MTHGEYRGQPNVNGIFLMNLLFGWTIAGWIVAMSWTLRRSAKVKRSHLRRILIGAVANDKAGRRPTLNYLCATIASNSTLGVA
jgi:T4 superinfection immunity protein